jgi:restriction system protein
MKDKIKKMNFLGKAKSVVNITTDTAIGFAKTATGITKGKVQEASQAISESSIINGIRSWVISLFVKAIESCSTEQDRMDSIAWLTIARETLANNNLSTPEKAQTLYKLMDTKRLAQGIFRSVSEAFENYKNADLPLALKIAIPVTIGAGVVVGGQGVGIAGFGTAIGAPVLLLIFLGVAGITSVLEAFLSRSEARDYISVVLSLIARDELLRRANNSMRKAMAEDIVAPKQKAYTKEIEAIRDLLLNMDAYDFEKHVMSFFQQQGLISWVTKKSNDFGVDGFARHSNGLIIVQCKRNAVENGVGRPTIQQFKGVIEENSAWRGYVVTTSYFTHEAIESAAKNPNLVIIALEELLEWHLNGIKIS